MSSWNLMNNAISWRDKFNLINFILKTDRYTQGSQVELFEKVWSEWLGCKHSLFVTSGSTANFLLIAAVMEQFNIKRGDKVLLPACTWMTNVAPPIQLGMEPVFCDINLQDYSFDDGHLEILAKEHPDIKIVFLTHLLGIPVNHSRIKKYFPDALILDDVCESHGCVDETGDKVGANSLGATFSFYYGHHMTTIEGGMISTNDSALYDLMKMKRSHGMARHSEHFDLFASQFPNIEKSFLFMTDGYNFRNTEMGAVLGLSQIKKLDRSIAIRQFNYELFVDINNSSSNLHPVTFHEGNSSFCFPLIGNSISVRNKLIDLFKKENIEYRPIVSGNLLIQPFLLNKVSSNYKFKNVEKLNNLGIYIGNNQFVTENHMKKLQNLVGCL